MGLRHNPITYLVLSNTLFWGLPLAINHWRDALLNREIRELNSAQLTDQKPSGAANDLLANPSGSPLVAGSAAGLPPLPSNPSATLAGSSPTHGSAITRMALALQSQAPRSASPNLLTQLSGADGLGGLITLASLDEPAVPIAARAERLQWTRSNDALAALPLHWRDPLRRQLGDRVRVSHAATVRLPVSELIERQELPVIITDQGVAEGLALPRDPRTRKAVETWAARQQPAQAGTVQVMVVAAEPVETPSVDAINVLAALPEALPEGSQHSNDAVPPSTAATP
jgi:hypothetical protein